MVLSLKLYIQTGFLIIDTRQLLNSQHFHITLKTSSFPPPPHPPTNSTPLPTNSTPLPTNSPPLPLPYEAGDLQQQSNIGWEEYIIPLIPCVKTENSDEWLTSQRIS